MVIFEVKRWFWQFRVLLIHYLIRIILFVWSLVFYMYDSYYVVPLSMFIILCFLYYFDKSDQQGFIKELRFDDEQKTLEIIYYKKAFIKMSKNIPYQFLWYSPAVAARSEIWRSDYTHCLIWYSEYTSHLYSHFANSPFKHSFSHGISTYTSTQFKAILKKLSEVGHLVDTTDDFFKGYTYSFFK